MDFFHINSKNINNTSTKIKQEKIKHMEEVLETNNKVMNMKWFIVEIVRNATMVFWEKYIFWG